MQSARLRPHKLKGGSRRRECVECGRIEHVRADNKATRCRSCSARANGAAGLQVLQDRVPEVRCYYCGSWFQRSRSELSGCRRVFCSRHCKHAAARIARFCKQCGSKFTVNIGRLSDETNSAANFCCRPCYERWLCQTDRVNGRGSRWRAIRAQVLKEQPFCAVCGLPDKSQLQVHHIIPYRLTRNNGKQNLIPLCSRCHKKVETVVHDFERAVADPKQIMLMFAFNLRDRQMATFQKLKQLHRGLR